MKVLQGVPLILVSQILKYKQMAQKICWDPLRSQLKVLANTEDSESFISIKLTDQDRNAINPRGGTPNVLLVIRIA